MIDSLHQLHVRPVLLTGDHGNAASAIAGQLRIAEVHADMLDGNLEHFCHFLS